MKFHALVLLRDAADILPQTLRHLLTWADLVHVLDTGSVDNTWDIVREAAIKDRRIVAVDRREVFYSDGLRAVLFESARQHASDGDWFLRTDDDEFYEIPPPVFVRERLLPLESVVFHQMYEFRLTRSEAVVLSEWKSVRRERLLPIAERRRHYNILQYAEPRMFRYRSGMQWHPDNSFPFFAGLPARERIPIRHYPHRDPEQLRRRVALRAAMTADGLHNAPHWTVASWESFLCDSNEVDLYHLAPGETLHKTASILEITATLKRTVQEFLYSGGVRLLDRFQPRYPTQYTPRPLPPRLQQSLRAEYELVS